MRTLQLRLEGKLHTLKRDEGEGLQLEADVDGDGLRRAVAIVERVITDYGYLLER